MVYMIIKNLETVIIFLKMNIQNAKILNVIKVKRYTKKKKKCFDCVQCYLNGICGPY